MPPLNYTTQIAVGKTIGEINELLGKAGATAIMTRYAAGEPIGVTFALPSPNGARSFTLPVDVTAMGKVLRRLRSSGGMSRAVLESDEHAGRVAWRVAKDWLAAQLTLVECGMAGLDQVMLPYLHVDGEVTLYQAWRENERAAIEARS